MTTLLEKNIEKLQKLPTKEQDNLASPIFQELEWEFRFENTQNELAFLAAEALAEKNINLITHDTEYLLVNN